MRNIFDKRHLQLADNQRNMLDKYFYKQHPLSSCNPRNILRNIFDTGYLQSADHLLYIFLTNIFRNIFGHLQSATNLRYFWQIYSVIFLARDICNQPVIWEIPRAFCAPFPPPLYTTQNKRKKGQIFFISAILFRMS